MKPNRILIVGHTNIGDICYDSALLSPLREAFPQAQISLLTSSGAKGIVEGDPRLHQIYLFDRHGKNKGWIGRLRLLLPLIQARFGLVIVLKSTWMHIFLGLGRRWVLKEKLMFDDQGRPIHRVEAYLKLLRQHGVRAEKPIFSFPIAERDEQFAEKFLESQGVGSQDTLIGISPLANWGLKCWSVENWNRLIQALKQQPGKKVLVFGKSSPDPSAQEILQHLSQEAISAVDQCTLKQSAALLKRCRLFLAPDTGLLHLASCLEIPCIGLYGATPVTHVIPYGQQERVIQSPADLPCKPCSTNPKTFAICGAPGGHAPCMEAIQVETVLAQIKKLLN